MDQRRAPTDLHRVFNQMLLSRRAMPDDVLLEMYKRCIEVVSANDAEFRPPRADNDGLKQMLVEVADMLEPIGLGIKRSADETSGRPWTALINIEGAGDIAQAATDLTPNELSYVRIVIAAIVDSYPANSIGTRHAMGLTRDLPSHMTQSAGEALLEAMCTRGWFSRSVRGRYSIASRGLMELNDYLREEYDEDIHSCKRCNRIVMTGYACRKPGCGAHYHTYCFGLMRGVHGEGREHCLECKTAFVDVPPAPIGEKAARRDDDDSARSQGRKRRRSGVNGHHNGNANINADDDDDDEELEPEEGASQEQRAVEEEEADEEDEENYGGRESQRRPPDDLPETIIPDSIEDEGEDEDDEHVRHSRRRRL